MTTTTETTALAVSRPNPAMGSRGILINSFDELSRFADTIAKSGFAPKGLESAQSIGIAIQMGLELGMTPMSALQGIAIINGRPGLFGDHQLALVRASGEVEEFEEWYEDGSGRLARNPSEFTDKTCAVCRVKRKGYAAKENAFNVADAKRAALWGKSGPWSQYPARMLRFRARSFLLRDEFGDVLRGFRTVEEMRDTPEERDVIQIPSFEPALPAATQQQNLAAPAEQSQPEHSFDRVKRRGPGRPAGLKSNTSKAEDAQPLPAPEVIPATEQAGELFGGKQPEKASPLENLRNVIKFHDVTEDQVFAAAKSCGIPMGSTLDDTPESSVKIMTDDFETLMDLITK